MSAHLELEGKPIADNPSKQTPEPLTKPDSFYRLMAYRQWFVQYDERFKGNSAQAAAHFLKLGLEAEYLEGLRAAAAREDPDLAYLSDGQEQALIDGSR